MNLMELKPGTLQLLLTGNGDIDGVAGDIADVASDIPGVTGDIRGVTGDIGDIASDIDGVAGDSQGVTCDTDGVTGDRQSRHRARKEALGLVQRTVWIPANAAADLKAWVKAVQAGRLPPQYPATSDPSRVAGLELEIERLREALAAAQADQAAMVPAGELELAQAELAAAQKAASQATQAREIQAANLGAEIARLKEAPARRASEKDARAAVFARAICQLIGLIRTEPGHSFDLAQKRWVGPKEAEIAKLLFQAHQIAPTPAGIIEDLLARDAQLVRPPPPRRRWWHCLSPKHPNSISPGARK